MSIEKAISQNLLIVSLGSLVFYYIASAIYNLYFSPLAKYPGPLLAKISAWPNFYYATTGYRHIWIWRCHEKYGDAFRFKPDGVLFNSPTAYRTIYQSKANVKKGKFYEMWPRNLNAPNTLGTVDKAVHARKRRVLNQAFSPEAIRSAENFVIQHVDRWNEILIDGNDGREWTEPVNISERIDYLVHDILGDLCFGRTFDLKEPRENQFRHLAQSPMVKLWVWLKPRGLDALLDKAMPEKIRQYHNFLASSVTQRRKDEEASKKTVDGTSYGRKDIFHYLFNATDEAGQPAYTNDELLEEAGLIVVAGTDTTANTISGFWFYVTRYPRVYSKLVEEIRTTFKSADDIKMGPTLSSCKYLHATIDEILRCCPSLPSDLNREVLPGGLNIEGHHLPAGTQVGVGGWAIMHNQQIFEDPWTFRPERWIVDPTGGVTAEDVARAQSAFNPFMIGVGSCAGQKVAMEELLITTARTLYRMEVRLAPGDTLGAGDPELGWGMRDRKTILLRDVFTAARDGPRLQFRRRV
ncbi:benzoate 4-monooxygenase cytochrome P450 protein [Rutstroemia sp. NJR-2017a BVV2]|nr:benzoate 4-monooxygenase cytochrome P450 protein [Rutstroemia sp. NJR-2017a BVV2]